MPGRGDDARPQARIFLVGDSLLRLETLELRELVGGTEADDMAQFVARLPRTHTIAFRHAAPLGEYIGEYPDIGEHDEQDDPKDLAEARDVAREAAPHRHDRLARLAQLDDAAGPEGRHHDLAGAPVLHRLVTGVPPRGDARLDRVELGQRPLDVERPELVLGDAVGRERDHHVVDRLVAGQRTRAGEDRPQVVQRPGVHGPDNQAKDLGGQNVLLSEYFFYWGSKAIPLPSWLLSLTHQTQGHKSVANAKLEPAFVQWIMGLGLQSGQLYGWPDFIIDWTGVRKGYGCPVRACDEDESDA